MRAAGVFLLEPFAGQSHKVAAHAAVAVVAHRMRGVIMASRQALVAIIKRDSSQLLVDQSLRQLLMHWVFAGASSPGDDCSLGPDAAAVAGDFFNGCSAAGD